MSHVFEKPLINNKSKEIAKERNMMYVQTPIKSLKTYDHFVNKSPSSKSPMKKKQITEFVDA